LLAACPLVSGKDELLPAPLLASWALEHVPGPPRVHLFRDLRHADILLYGPAQVGPDFKLLVLCNVIFCSDQTA